MESLQPFHTFSTPAQAEKIIAITSIAQLLAVSINDKKNNIPSLVLGQGSNVLFLEDFQGTVLLNRLLGISYTEDEYSYFVHINSGENWHQTVEWCLTQGIYGLENLALIPGCVGSAPIQNIGAYGVELKDFCNYVDVINLETGIQQRLTVQECQFGYRESVFKHHYAKCFVIVAVGLTFNKKWQPCLNYGPLATLNKDNITAHHIFSEVCRLRKQKLPDPKTFGNAGSFFKNPLVTTDKARDLLTQYPAMPIFHQTDTKVKLAAAWLIDQCGLKGFMLGGAAVHKQQPLVIINADNASSADIVKLASYVCHSVAERFDIWLEPEVRFIGALGEVEPQKVLG